MCCPWVHHALTIRQTCHSYAFCCYCTRTFYYLLDLWCHLMWHNHMHLLHDPLSLNKTKLKLKERKKTLSNQSKTILKEMEFRGILWYSSIFLAVIYASFPCSLLLFMFYFSIPSLSWYAWILTFYFELLFFLSIFFDLIFLFLFLFCFFYLLDKEEACDHGHMMHHIIWCHRSRM